MKKMAKAKYYGNATVQTGVYKDKDGNDKKKFLVVGGAIEFEGGGMVVNVEALPLNRNLWDGKIYLHPKKDNDEKPADEASF